MAKMSQNVGRTKRRATQNGVKTVLVATAHRVPSFFFGHVSTAGFGPREGHLGAFCYVFEFVAGQAILSTPAPFKWHKGQNPKFGNILGRVVCIAIPGTLFEGATPLV